MRRSRGEQNAPFAYQSTPPKFAGALERADQMQLGEVTVLQTRTTGMAPGQAMQYRVYLPPGAEGAPPGSLKAVLVAPAGTNLLGGAKLGDLNQDAYHREALILVVFLPSVAGLGRGLRADDEI